MAIAAFIGKSFFAPHSCSHCQSCTQTYSKKAEGHMAMSSPLKNHICDFSLLTRILNCQNIGEKEIWLHGSNNQQEKNGPGNYKSGNQGFIVEAWGSYIFLLPFQRNLISALLHSFILQKGTASGKPLLGRPRDSPIFLETWKYLTCSLPDSHGFFIFPYHQKGIFPDCRNFNLRRNSP